MKELIDRCKICTHCRLVKAYPDFSFYGCFCAPNRGKWIIELKKCPKQSPCGDTGAMNPKLFH